MIILDASVLIAHLDGDDVFHPRARRLLLDVVGLPLRASPMTVAEALVAPTREGLLDHARARLAELAVREIPLPADASTRLAVLRKETGCKLPDCCVLLTAEQVGGAVATFDARLAGAARDRHLDVHDGSRRDGDEA